MLNACVGFNLFSVDDELRHWVSLAIALAANHVDGAERRDDVGEGRAFEHLVNTTHQQETRGPQTALVRPARAVAFERQTEEEAIARFPELKTAYGIMRTFEDEGRASGKITDANVGQFRATLKLKMTSALDTGKLPKLLERGIVKPDRPSPDRGR